MKILKVFLLSFLWVFYSCQFFNTEKISSETFYEEELESIDWNDVDAYPAFKECESYTEKEDQKPCFQNTIVAIIKAKLLEEKLVTSQSIYDTVTISLLIDKTGVVQVETIKTDSLLLSQIPSLPILLENSIKSLPNPSPAYKRGIPVNTTVKLPFILNSEEL